MSSLQPLPPPLPQVIPSILNKKRKKKFTLSTTDHTQTDSRSGTKADHHSISDGVHHDGGSCHHEGRLLIIPYLHYGLEKIGARITIMDKDNLLTRSPTLVSLGGSSLVGGLVDFKLYYLDLEPPMENGGEMNVEFEWKELKCDTELLTSKFKDHLYYFKYGCLQYCKKRQSLLFLLSKLRLFEIYEFSLVKREWKMYSLEGNYDDYITLDQTENYVIGIYRLNFMRLLDFDDIFDNIGIEQGRTPKEISHFTPNINDRMPIAPGLITPVLDKQMLFLMNTSTVGIFGPKPPDLYAINLNSGEPCTSLRLSDYEATRPTITGFPNFEILDDLSIRNHSPNKLLISVYSHDKKVMFFVKDVNKDGVDQVSHNPLPIELKHHALFDTISFGYVSKKNERRALIMPSNDLIFIIKLDYFDIGCAFPFIKSFQSRNDFTDITFWNI